MMKRLAALTAAIMLAAGVCASAVTFTAPMPKAIGGVLVDLLHEEPEYTITMGMSFGNIGIEFGVAMDKVILFPTINKNWLFTGLMVSMPRPTSEAEFVNVALPIGIQMTSPAGFVRIGYSYPIVSYVEPGLFVEFALEVDFFDLIGSEE